MGAACSRCCCSSCCGDNDLEYHDLDWVDYYREFPGASGRFKICAASVSNDEISLKWQKTCCRSSHYTIMLTEMNSTDFVYYVEPRPDQRMVSFTGLKPSTLHEVYFCKHEVYSWSDGLLVRTADGPDLSLGEPRCTGLDMVCRNKKSGAIYSSMTGTNAQQDIQTIHRCLTENQSRNYESIEYRERRSSERDPSTYATDQCDHTAETRPLLPDSVTTGK